MIAIQPKSRQLLGVNQQAYQALKASMSLNLRRQLLIAVCDDVRMQNQLATRLEKELGDPDRARADLSNLNVSNSASLELADPEALANALRLERLTFDPEEGNLPQQVAQWVRHTMLSEGSLPKLQVLGIEQMIHQPSITQNYFLRSLEKIEALLPRLNTSLLIWVPWPWLRTIQQSSPIFWNWRNGVFEFVSDPTPTPASRDSLRFELPLSAPENELPESLNPESLNPESLNNGSHRERLSSSPDGTADPLRSATDTGLYGEMRSELCGESLGEGVRDRPLDIALAPFNGEFPMPDVAEVETVARERALKQPVPEIVAPIVAPVEPRSDGPEKPASDEISIELLNEVFSEIPDEVSDDILGIIPDEILDDRNAHESSDLLERLTHVLNASPTRLANPSNLTDSAASSADDGITDDDITDYDITDYDIFSLGGLHSIVSQGVNVLRPIQRLDPGSVEALDAIPLEGSAIAQDFTETDDWIDDDLADDLANDLADDLVEVTLSEQEFAALGWDDFCDETPAAAMIATVMAAESGRQQAAEYFATGLAYRARIEAGERSLEVIDPAIAAYESGLSCMVEPHADWATGLNDLGTLYWLKAQQQEHPQQAVVFMNQSIRLYQEALSKIQLDQSESVSEGQPDIISQLYSNMGAVYTVLATCETPLMYLKKAAETYQQVLPMVSLETYPEEYATLQNSLGSVFWKLSHYDSAAAYLHQAIAAYDEALLGYNPVAKPLDYAAVQNNLGITYWSLAKQEQPEFLLKRAIAAYRDALNYRTADVDPSACAISYNNLALAYWDLAKYTLGDLAQKSRYQKNAVTAFEAALNISKLSGALNAMDSAAIYHCLGDVHAQMLETAPSRVEIAESLQKSLYSYIKAIEGLPSDEPAYPGRFTAVVANLKLHYDKLGLEGQQSALNRVPPTLLPQVMMAL